MLGGGFSVGMYRKAMSMNVAEGDDSHHGRCDDGKELLCPLGAKNPVGQKCHWG